MQRTPPPPNLLDLLSSCWRCYKQSGGRLNLISLVYCCLLKKKRKTGSCGVIAPLVSPPFYVITTIYIFFSLSFLKLAVSPCMFVFENLKLPPFDTAF